MGESPDDKPSPNDEIQIANKVQMPKSKCLKAKRKGGIDTAPAAALCWVYCQVLGNLTCGI